MDKIAFSYRIMAPDDFTWSYLPPAFVVLTRKSSRTVFDKAENQEKAVKIPQNPSELGNSVSWGNWWTE